MVNNFIPVMPTQNANIVSITYLLMKLALNVDGV